MNEERQNERDSQLSAMFDGELPGAECELLARRLTRDESLRAQWSRFSMIGAALRAERGVALHDRVAWRVSSMVAQEATYGDGVGRLGAHLANRAHRSRQRTQGRVGRPLDALRAARCRRQHRRRRRRDVHLLAAHAGRLADAMLAAIRCRESIVLAPDTTDRHRGASIPRRAVEARTSNGEPDRYVTPAPSSSASIAPPARLANYVVAHSEYSGPLSRRMALLGLVATDPAEVPATLDAGDTPPPQELSMRRDSRIV